MKAINKPSTMAKIVANNIRRVREFRNYTQEYVSAKMGITQNAYSKLESGASKMSLERLFQIANILDVNSTDLLLQYEEDIIQLRVNSPAGQFPQRNFDRSTIS